MAYLLLIQAGPFGFDRTTARNRPGPEMGKPKQSVRALPSI